MAALSHDIGKILVPEVILSWPGPLCTDAIRIMRCHVTIGHDILADNPAIGSTALAITRHHHEMLDGSGYPDGLSGDAISRDVRLATICDIFTALIEPRAYKPALRPEEALRNMRGMAGQIDMTLLATFADVIGAELGLDA